MGKKLVIVGAGGHCKSVLDAVLSADEYENIVIVDPSIQIGTIISGCKVVGSDDQLIQLREAGFQYAFISIGSIKDTNIRRKAAENVKKLGFLTPIIIDPSAIVASTATIGEGSYVGKRAVINAYARLGKFCIANTGCVVEHESIVDDFCHISVGSILCGNVKIKQDCFIGSGSVVIQGVNVQKNSVIGAGSVVISDVPGQCTVVGNPARILKKM